MRKAGGWGFLVLLLMGTSAFPANPSFENRAALSWTLFDNRRGFSDARETIDRLFTHPRGAFRIPAQNYFPLEIRDRFRGKASYESALDAALRKLDGQREAILYLFIHTHGNETAFERQWDESISYEDYLSLVLAKVAARPHPPVMHFLISACESERVLTLLKRRLEDARGKYTDGDRHYRLKADILVSSPQNFFSYYNWFAEQIDALSSLHEEEAEGFTKADWPAFTAPLGTEKHFGWSSYETVPERGDLRTVLVASHHHQGGQPMLGPKYRRDVAEKTWGYLGEEVSELDKMRLDPDPRVSETAAQLLEWRRKRTASFLTSP